MIWLAAFVAVMGLADARRMTTSRQQTAWLGAATQAWQFYLVLPSFILNLLRHTALTTALTTEADKCGFGQGELRGMTNNLG